MTDTDPQPLTRRQRRAAQVRSMLSLSGSAKAYVAGAIGVAVVFVGTLGQALAGDNYVSPVEWTVIASASLVAAGGLFGGVYATKND